MQLQEAVNMVSGSANLEGRAEVFLSNDSTHVGMHPDPQFRINEWLPAFGAEDDMHEEV
jgi:hypothetical protein